ncbi:double-strand break repair helicase AddA [Devosia sp. SL43]|uniref:double-strand break repair helicase AddA n=1 Tax=Devosia sp. SL43 TaxID=2806348 RepID=UPI001F00E586|nr:double-strand break repair helicase AddA [Devosia sp. SL43]UJW84579.1 double-strand break repair helicase AddA [Devosia sp. SL43]
MVVSERGAMSVPPETRRHQALASHPHWSIWVEANAGSGKTYVLTRRVLRLLLSGVRPQAILCLTYTKAAAAEMRSRVAARLADWATMDEAALIKDLKEIEGKDFVPDMVERARTLFARALETPGGLKILTIHAFCESILHRFPIEAGVPFDFSVIEDEERKQMILAAREAVLADGLRGAGPADAVETLFALLSDFQISQAIELALMDGRKLRTVLAKPDNAKTNLRKLADVAFPRAGATIEAEVVTGRLLDGAAARKLLSIANDALRKRLDGVDLDHPQQEDWKGIFLTEKDELQKNFPAKAVWSADPGLAQLVADEAERLATMMTELRSAQLIERSEALLDVVAAIAQRYEARKRARSRLDFDDLVERLGSLFADRDVGAWVQYKLDTAIDHVLVDESQDTNPEQWKVVRAIAEEFFAGAAGTNRRRSLFAVGDQKQSIYSFQGAEPTLFAETGLDFGVRARQSAIPFERLPLHTSFRTLPEILRAVDLVSDQADIQAALLSIDKVHHDTARQATGGLVTLWPPIQQLASATDDADWPIQAQGGERTAPRQVAERIAGEIAGWIARKRPLANRGVAVRPQDVLILVQSRGALFQEIIRALRKHNLPTPGADRLEVSTHIAVLDLLALCDVLLNPADDLQLAALLRSPLFDVSEDDLYTLAQPRDDHTTLWRALQTCTTPSCMEAYARLFRWRGELDFERPFEFLTEVLYAGGGLRRFHARLGDEVDEVFAELLELALKHEQGTQPSLQGFVAELRQTEISIKRNLDETSGGVRVMTVHGAKGLEAPIVILADAASKPQGNQVNRPVYVLDKAPGPLLMHASGSRQHAAGSKAARDAIEANLGKEYWRKLYVAMTRAEDELYVTGPLTPATKAERQLEDTWYQAIERALREHSEVKLDADGREIALVYPRERVEPHAVKSLGAATAAGRRPIRPAAVPAPAVVPLVSPSRVGAHVAPILALDSLAEQVRDAEGARREGIALHALLQHLGRIERNDRPDIAARALEALLLDAAADHARLAAKAISILDHPELAHVFGPSSRAELPFLVDAERDGKAIRLTGRIDRLVVDERGVTVVDYKSDASVPGGPGDVPGNYVTQLGLYALVAGQLFPGRQVYASILWTRLESLMNLPPDLLATGTKGFTMR